MRDSATTTMQVSLGVICITNAYKRETFARVFNLEGREFHKFSSFLAFPRFMILSVAVEK